VARGGDRRIGVEEELAGKDLRVCTAQIFSRSTVWEIDAPSSLTLRVSIEGWPQTAAPC